MQRYNNESIKTTNTLKGFAILAVIINHFTNIFISNNYGGFANQIIAIFFFVSGYGLFNSAKREFGAAYTIKRIFLFYYKRFICPS
jgi:peptidoglycan/LPS O-acetylase OafA/YrhL